LAAISSKSQVMGARITLALQPTGKFYVKYARYLFDIVLQALGHFFEPCQPIFARDVDDHDRYVGEIYFRYDRFIRVFRQVCYHMVYIT